MNSYVKVTNGKPKFYTIGQLRQDNPDTGFPRSPSDDLLASWGIYPVTDTPRPEHDPMTQDIAEGDPVLKRSKWARTWVIRELTLEELEVVLSDAASAIRQLRNQRLKETDWVVVYHTERGTNIPLEWEQYRQDLRNITDHVNFPRLTEEDWPVKPE